jgi:hypothetical protein
MKIFSTLSLFILVQAVHAQQYNFNQLIEMTNDNKVFEIKMIKAVNSPYKKRTPITYLYHTLDKSIGGSGDIPTNDKKYEEIYKFDDGQNYTQSEIEDNNLDEDYSIRNKLRKEGMLINEYEIAGYQYHRSKITSLIKCEDIEIGYADNYDFEKKTASTWYTWKGSKYKKIILTSKLFSPNYKKLTVEFVSDKDFASIIKQITAVSKYIDTNEDYGSFVSSYKYGFYKITSEKRNKGNGGIITIYIEQK